MANLPARSEKEMVYKMNNGDEMRLTMNTVRNYLVQGQANYVTDSELLYFMHECKARKLNPFLRQCWLIKYSQNDSAQIVESIHHKRSKARQAPDCAGWEKGLILKDKDGNIKHSKGLVLDGETVLGAYFNATPKGWVVPYELEINLSGYIKKKRDGSVTQFWQKEKQPSQIMKVAESQGLSALWGDTIGNTYIPEELPPAIDFSQDKLGVYESAPDTTEFDRLLNSKLDEDDPEHFIFRKYLEEMAGSQEPKMTAEQFKAEAVGQFEEMWKHFEKWQAGKSKEKPSVEPVPQQADDDPWREDVWIKLRSKGFSTHVFKNLSTFKAAPVTIQGKVIEKWGKLYPDTPFPTGEPLSEPEGVIVPPEPPEIPDDDQEPEPTFSDGITGYEMTDAAVLKYGMPVYEEACTTLNYPDGPFSAQSDRAFAATMQRIAEK